MKLVPPYVMDTRESAPILWSPKPMYPCRQMETRHCPARYSQFYEGCHERPCARFESEDPWPWVAELIDWDE